MKENLPYLCEIFKVLSDPTRLKLIHLIATNMEDRLGVVMLSKKLGVSQPAASQHLRILKKAGIVNLKKEGYNAYYFLNFKEMKEVKQKMDQLFTRAFEKCPGDCSKCPQRLDCLEEIPKV